MGAKSKIEWTDSTFNPWVGCTKVARARGAPSACDFCYAEKWAKRSGQVEWGNHPRRRTTEAYWRNPLAWNNRARLFQTEHGRRQRVFCASLSDVFDNQVDPSWRADLFNLIRACDELDWQLLTKRPQNIRKMLPVDWGDGYPNVWLGTSIESDRYTFRADWLRRTPAAVRFLSLEPLLGPLPSLDLEGIGWVIVGGESGPGARPVDPDWVRDLRDRSVDAGVPFFFKQWGGRTPKAGGRELDGRTWDEYPSLDGRTWDEYPS
jgi:protein gp37